MNLKTNKILKAGALTCAGIAAVLILLGSLAVLFGDGRLFHHFWANYFYPSVSFILAGILLMLFVIADRDKS